MPTYTTEALVLKRRNLGEADRLITLLTPEYGKFTAIAKGIRKPTSRKSSHLELFTHCRVFLARGRNLDIITQAETIAPYRLLGSDYEHIVVASSIAEILNRMVQDRDPQKNLFDLVIEGMQQLDQTESVMLTRALFLLKLVQMLGFQPEFATCRICGGQVTASGAVFSHEHGGLVCRLCVTKLRYAGACVVSPQGCVLLDRLQREQQWWDECAPSAILLAEVSCALDGYLQFISERELKSFSMLDTR
jgi:DNA repair protein RecO (recombination protein O)